MLSSFENPSVPPSYNVTYTLVYGITGSTGVSGLVAFFIFSFKYSSTSFNTSSSDALSFAYKSLACCALFINPLSPNAMFIVIVANIISITIVLIFRYDYFLNLANIL